MKNFLPSLLLALTFVIPSQSVSAEIASPVLGFVYDKAARNIRLLSGVPGASLLEEPIEVGFPISSAVASPKQNYVLVRDAESNAIRIVQLRQSQVLVSSIPGLLAADRIGVSPAGTAAALYDALSQRLQIVAGLPGNPAIRRSLDLSGRGVPAAVAVTDDGELALIVVDGVLSVGNGDSTLFQLNLPTPVTAIAVRAGAHDLLMAGTDGRLFRAADLATALTFEEVAASAKSSASVLAVEFSSDGRSAYSLFPEGLLLSTDLQTGLTTQISCQCAASGLQRLKPGTLFQISELSTSPVMLFDVSENKPQVWFVPSPTSLSGSERSSQ